MTDTNFYNLIPELEEWGDLNGHPYDPQDWLCGVGTFDQAVAFTTIFWPTFCLYDDCIFIDEPPDPANYKTWLETTNGQKHRVEALLNHLHLEDLFGTVTPTHLQLEYLGPKVCEMWKSKALQDFPDREIVTEFYPGDESDLTEYQITLFQAPSKS